MSGSRKTKAKRDRAAGHLLILACSQTKRPVEGLTPAIHLYDGNNFRVLRNFLARSGWPAGLSIAVLSGKYGLIDASTLIESYDLRLTRKRAERLNAKVTSALAARTTPVSIYINVGKDYLPALANIETIFKSSKIIKASGGIGTKMKAMKAWLEELTAMPPSLGKRVKDPRKYLYFFPDWDDFVYEPFRSSSDLNLERRPSYAHEIFKKSTPFDGVLLSLSHLTEGKGILSRMPDTGRVNLRRRLRLPQRLILFGDCGAFSYASEPEPPITPKEALHHYERFGFDIGASVDHIPLPEITIRERDGTTTRKHLSAKQRSERMILTRDNAAEFISLCNKHKVSFAPLGVIQGLGTRSYVERAHEYVEMGYQHIALGGLVPRTDSAIVEILAGVRQAIQHATTGGKQPIWVHLFGVLRPRVQGIFRDLGANSFDSASYFRKAWLRSDQNYLSSDGSRWYGTMRIPFSNSSRVIQGAEDRNISSRVLLAREQRCLDAIEAFDGTAITRTRLMRTLAEYGPILDRKAENNHFSEKHSTLLREQPWNSCRCPFCRDVGIQVAVFRGAARNKRRGFHNTWVFYHKVLHGSAIPTLSGASEE